MVSLSLYLGHKDLLIIIGLYTFILLMGMLVSYIHYSKKLSNYKYFGIGVAVIYLLIGWVNANYYIKDGIDRSFLVLTILYITSLYLIKIAYNYLNDVEAYKKSSYLMFVVIAIFAISGFSTAIDIGRYLNKTEELIAEVEEEPKDIEVDDLLVDGKTPLDLEVDLDTEVTAKAEVNKLCDTDNNIYIKDCYESEEKYVQGAYKDDAIINKYNTLNKSISFAKATQRDAEMKVKFLTEFNKEIKVKEPDNQLIPIVEELKVIVEKESSDSKSKIESYSELHTILVQQIKQDSEKTPEIKSKLENLGDLNSTTTLFDYVNSIFSMEDDNIMTQDMKKWVYDYIDKNEVK